jgi:hypothetical protein
LPPTAPGTVTLPTSVSIPAVTEYSSTLPLPPALEVNSCPPSAVTQQVAACPVSTASIWAMVPSACSAKVASALGPASAITRSPAGSAVMANGTVPGSEFTAGPGEAVRLGYSVALPVDARPGSHWWAPAKVMYFGRLRYTESVQIRVTG